MKSLKKAIESKINPKEDKDNTNNIKPKSYFNKVIKSKGEFGLDEYYIGKNFKAYSKLYKSFLNDHDLKESEVEHKANISMRKKSKNSKDKKIKITLKEENILDNIEEDKYIEDDIIQGVNELNLNNDDDESVCNERFNTDYMIYANSNEDFKKNKKSLNKAMLNNDSSNDKDTKDSNIDKDTKDSNTDSSSNNKFRKSSYLENLRNEMQLSGAMEILCPGTARASNSKNDVTLIKNDNTSNNKPFNKDIQRHSVSNVDSTSLKLKRRAIMTENIETVLIKSFKKENKKNTHWPFQKNTTCNKCSIL